MRIPSLPFLLLAMATLTGTWNLHAESSPTPPGNELERASQLTPTEVMSAMADVRKQRGNQAAASYLADKLRASADSADAFCNLFQLTWDEAQTGSGRTDAVFAYLLNDTAFTIAFEQRYYHEAFDIISNLCYTLNATGRYGRYAEVMAIWAEAQRLGGNQLNPAAYPDLGPAIPGFEFIRRRQIPVILPHTKDSPQGHGPRSRTEKFEPNQLASVHSYAEHLLRSGRWQEAVEWIVWVREFSSEKGSTNPDPSLASNWYEANMFMGDFMQNVGYYDEALALYESLVRAPQDKAYGGKEKINSDIRRLNTLRLMNRAPSDIVPQLRGLVERTEKHPFLGKSELWWAKSSLAKALIHTHSITEGEALFESLIAEGSSNAREARLEYWLDSHRTQGVEEELIAVLRMCREVGNKSEELWLYMVYADFLEANHRDQEALAMRREAVRYCREFNEFTDLPVQLAKLAALLQRFGDESGSAAGADEARRLLAGGRIPNSRKEDAEKFLDQLRPARTPPTPVAEPTPAVDLQPQRSVVVPLEKEPWTSFLTLANPDNREAKGRFKIHGMPLQLSTNEENGDITAALSGQEDAKDSELALVISPGSYRLIHLTADAAFKNQGELKFTWTPERGQSSVDATVQIDAPETGVEGAIIQAGNYKSNPFYGVPVHLHYVTKIPSADSSPLRFVCSLPARVEVYLLDGTVLAIDGKGNGSLLDPGDELFAKSDGKGNLLLPLTAGSASFRVMLYPQGPLPKDGITLSVEAYENGQWNLHSENRLTP